MPELPEVETVRRGLEAAWEGRAIVSVEQRRHDLRFPFPPGLAERVRGRTVRAVRRRAKQLIVLLDDGQVLRSHLGMSGRWTLHRGEGDGATLGVYHRDVRASDVFGGYGPHDHLVFSFDDGHVAVYTDHRRFGWVDLFDGIEDLHAALRDVGPEPLAMPGLVEGAPMLTVEGLASRLAQRRTPIKTALLDQRIVAGLGNIYVCEALHRSGVSPRRQASTLVQQSGRPTERLKRLFDAVVQVLEEAVASGGSTLADFRGVDGELGYFPHHFRVYDREGLPCPGRVGRPCGRPVTRFVQSGRSTFACGACQR